MKSDRLNEGKHSNGECENCLSREETITVCGNGDFGTHEITKDNWEILIDSMHEVDKDFYDYEVFKHYNLCPFGIITPFSFELYNLYNDCAGFSRVQRPSDRYSLPALYVDAVKIINSELSKLKDVGNGSE